MIVISEACRNDMIAGLICAAIGFLLIIWPERIQKRQIQFQDRHPKLAALNPFAEWNRSTSAVILIRCSGLIPILFARVAFYFAIKNCFKSMFTASAGDYQFGGRHPMLHACSGECY
ncbi:MAG: hypothetical protein DMG36_13330 [Acidobacteria bacterium]|nr:MAG: hypothetical protein DMG36_13330 [Acidobacteriota bacterium]